MALHDGQVVGFSCGRLVQRDVWALFIDSAHEGRGVGNRLMELLENWMFSAGSVAKFVLGKRQKTDSRQHNPGEP